MFDGEIRKIYEPSADGHRRPQPARSRTGPGRLALLVTGDASLGREVGRAVGSVDGLGLEVAADEGLALDRMAAGPVDLLLIHLSGEPNRLGLIRLVREARWAPRRVEVIVIDDGPVAGRAGVLRGLGAADWLTRPLDPGRLGYLLEILTLPGTRASAPGPDGFPGAGEPAAQIARSDAALLLVGEPGTGKSRLARRVHGLSPRRDRPFLAVDCGGDPARPVESELFGHARGAMPGAGAGQVGKLAEVGEGTLLLDEVGSLPMALQVKLLRAIEERAFEPVGSGTPSPMKARLIATSRRPLELEVTEGRFRADLYYRLDVLSLKLPALREKVGAIPGLAREFLEEFAALGDGRARDFSPEAMLALQAYPWPGNIRELRDAVEWAARQSVREAILPGDLPVIVRMDRRPTTPTGPGDAPGDHLPLTLTRSRQEMERGRIEQALAKHRNHRLRTAEELGISRVTLYRKLRKYGLPTEDGEG